MLKVIGKTIGKVLGFFIGLGLIFCAAVLIVGQVTGAGFAGTIYSWFGWLSEVIRI